MSQIARVTVQVGDSETRTYRLKVGSRELAIPVSVKVYTNFQNQFAASKTEKAAERRKTLNALMRAAYEQGQKDGSRKP